MSLATDLNLIKRCIANGQLAQAERMARDILRKQPTASDALRMLGDVCYLRTEFQAAFDFYQRAIALRASFENVQALAVAAEMQRMFDTAEKNYHILLQINPAHADTYYRLAEVILAGGGAVGEAVTLLRLAVEKGFPIDKGMTRIGYLAQWMLNDRNMARSAYLQALDSNPAYIDAMLNLAILYWMNNHVNEAMLLMQQAMELSPDRADIYQVFSASLLKAGQHKECHEFFQKAIVLAPENPVIYSSYLNSLNCSDLLTQPEWFAEHRKYNQIVVAKAKPFLTHDNLADPTRRLRVGYVSADLRHHSVASFFEPLIANHNREKFEIFCYYNNHAKDAVTDRIKSMADHWCDCILLTDEELVAKIRADKIDLLVDLTGHTADSRLPVFAWKPAPVQFTWLGYGPTTGVKAIDYIFVDHHYVANDDEAQYFVEKPVFLQNYRVFQMPADLPVKPLPALHNGYVTFGSFNSFVKVSHSLLSLWADILNRVPDSRLSIIIESVETTRSVKEYFLSRGIAEERLMLFNKLRYDHFLQLHYYVDIALDTYPFNGFTTSFNGLWMGVPMLTLRGQRMASKTGGGMLTPLGLQEFIANSAEEYVEKACQWASRLPQLAEIRNDLRGRMQKSTLMDNVSFACDFENILRDCWVRWCAEKS